MIKKLSRFEFVKNKLWEKRISEDYKQIDITQTKRNKYFPMKNSHNFPSSSKSIHRVKKRRKIFTKKKIDKLRFFVDSEINKNRPVKLFCK